MVPEDRQPHFAACADAKRAQLFGRGQQLALLAVVEIGNDVQSLHFDTPFQAKICSRGLRARPRATRLSGQGLCLSCRGALRQRAAGEILFAEDYPSEKYRVKKCASIIA